MRALAKRVAGRFERLAMGRKAYKWVIRDWKAITDLEAAARVFATMRLSQQIEPQLLDGPHGRRFLVVAPHPDDEIIGPGGTLLRLKELGASIQALFVTSGGQGEHETRRQEAETACLKGGFETRFLEMESGRIDIQSGAALLAEAIKQKAPDGLFVPFLLDDNFDHRQVNHMLSLALDLLPGKGPEIWAYQVYTPLPGNVVVDITEQAERKAEIISLYSSQMQRRNWAHFALGLNAVNCRFLPGSHSEKYAECFFVLPATDYRDLCRHYFQDLGKVSDAD